MTPRVRDMIDALRDGAWLTRERLRVYPLLLGVALLALLAATVATGDGLRDRWGRPIGTDFSQVWVAGLEVHAGHAAQPYDNAAHAAAQEAAFGASDGFYSWPYPPYFLAVAGLAAFLPYLVALALWQGATALLYLGAVRRAARGASIGRGRLIVAALVYPAVSINLLHGHNGFLTAGLLGFGAMLAPRRPILAGMLLGLLVYKPQFALVVPVALLAAGAWRAAAAALATVLLATAASVLAFGLEPWRRFLTTLEFTRRVVLENGGPGFGKMQSAFAAVRLLGGSVSLAYAAQGLLAGLVLLALAWLWRGRADDRLKTAGLLVASLLATPYGMDYDMVVLGPALAALTGLGVAGGFRPYGRTILALAWVMPLLARPLAVGLDVPIGAVVMAVLFWHISRWAMSEVRELDRCQKTTDVSTSEPVPL